jgi:hypothetical protein
MPEPIPISLTSVGCPLVTTAPTAAKLLSALQNWGLFLVIIN